MAAVDEQRRVRSHPAVRTLILTRGELSAWLLDDRTQLSQQLNTAAAAVWALLEEPTTVDQLTSDLAETFGLEDHVARETVEQALETFREADLVVDDDDESDSAEAAEATQTTATEGTEDAELPPALTRAPDP